MSHCFNIEGEIINKRQHRGMAMKNELAVLYPTVWIIYGYFLFGDEAAAQNTY